MRERHRERKEDGGDERSDEKGRENTGVRLKDMKMNKTGMLVAVGSGGTKEGMRGMMVEMEGIGAGVSKLTEANLSRMSQTKKMMLLGVHLGQKEERRGVEDGQHIGGTGTT